MQVLEFVKFLHWSQKPGCASETEFEISASSLRKGNQLQNRTYEKNRDCIVFSPSEKGVKHYLPNKLWGTNKEVSNMLFQSVFRREPGPAA